MRHTPLVEHDRHRPRILALLVLTPALLISNTMVKAADAVAACVTSSNDFDRPDALRKTSIVGPAGSRVPLYRKYPTECAGSDIAACQGRAYLIPGDEVEVARTCGGYSRVTYTGKSRVSSGWVEERALKAETAADAKPSSAEFLSEIEGYYLAPGRLCSTSDGEKLEPCNPATL